MPIRLKEPAISIREVGSSNGILDMFKALIHNDQAMTVVASIILVYTSINICGNLILYFFKFDVGNEGAYSVFAAVVFAAQVLVMMIVPALRRKFTKFELFIFGFIIQIAGFAMMLLLAVSGIYTSDNWYVFCLPGCMVYIGYGILNVIMTIFLSDSVDYGEVKNKTREESVIFSMQTFTVKLASGLAIFLAGIYMSIANFHQEVIPTELLFAIVSSRESVPFPILFEMLIMEISFELIREASIRVPSPIGPTIGIVGALVLGQAAVDASIVSPILIIIVSITAICSFAVPDFSLGFHFRIMRFVYIILGALAGFLGIAAGFCTHLLILKCTLDDNQ